MSIRRLGLHVYRVRARVRVRVRVRVRARVTITVRLGLGLGLYKLLWQQLVYYNVSPLRGSIWVTRIGCGCFAAASS